MTIEEAIERLYELQFYSCCKADESVSMAKYWDKTVTAIDMAIAALEEQKKRSVGCKYCREYESIVEENGDFISFDATLSKGIFLEACTCDVVLEAKVLFCPMCGRRLEEV